MRNKVLRYCYGFAFTGQFLVAALLCKCICTVRTWRLLSCYLLQIKKIQEMAGI